MVNHVSTGKFYTNWKRVVINSVKEYEEIYNNTLSFSLSDYFGDYEHFQIRLQIACKLTFYQIGV